MAITISEELHRATAPLESTVESQSLPTGSQSRKGFPDPLRFKSLMDAVAEEAAEMNVAVDFDGIVLE